MELIFLGTSAGIPTPARNVTAIAVKSGRGKTWCLVDCGEGTQHQLMKSSLKLNSLASIFITHVHGDHCFGLPGLLASLALHGRRKPLQIVGPTLLSQWVTHCIEFSQMYMPYEIEFIAVETLESISSGVFNVTASELSHRVPSYAYRFVEFCSPVLDTDKLQAHNLPPGPSWGHIQKGRDVTLPDGTVVKARDYLIAVPVRCAVVAGDNDKPELLQRACREAQVLVHEATFTESVSQQVGPAPQHSSALQVAQFAQSIGLPNLILTHFSARYGDHEEGENSINQIAQEASRYFHGNLFLARDFSHYVLTGDDTITEKIEDSA